MTRSQRNASAGQHALKGRCACIGPKQLQDVEFDGKLTREKETKWTHVRMGVLRAYQAGSFFQPGHDVQLLQLFQGQQGDAAQACLPPRLARAAQLPPPASPDTKE